MITSHFCMRRKKGCVVQDKTGFSLRACCKFFYKESYEHGGSREINICKEQCTLIHICPRDGCRKSFTGGALVIR